MNLMTKVYDIENMTQEHLNEIGLERNTLARRINEKNESISNIISKIEKVVLETQLYQEDRELSIEEILKELYKAKEI